MATKSPHKSQGGVARLSKALQYSRQGLVAAFHHEAAFRQELLLVAVLAPVAVWLGRSVGEVLFLLGTLFFVLIVELLNSGLETLADAITLENHTLIGRAKDLGSAAVMLSLIFLVLAWTSIAVSRFWPA